MYAVICSGGKQYRVEKGQKLKLEKLPSEIGANIDFEQILLVGLGSDINIGHPYLTKGKVSAKVINHGRGEKLKIQKFRRRKHHDKVTGHRQDYTEVEITQIEA